MKLTRSMSSAAANGECKDDVGGDPKPTLCIVPLLGVRMSTAHLIDSRMRAAIRVPTAPCVGDAVHEATFI
jgi:hypothetical protein